jgi:hypothetical protein
MNDYTFENHGSIWLCRPSTADARQHLQAHTDTEAQWFGGALVVEPRYVANLAEQLTADGFTVEN